MNKLNLFIILILSIVFSLGFRVIEGVCNYDIKSASKEQKKTLCAATNIHKNNLEICPICLVSVEEIQTVECKHGFCINCINKWMDTNHKTCPCCRGSLNAGFNKYTS